jgi:gluconate 2-dehydrogenase gamma chain
MIETAVSRRSLLRALGVTMAAAAVPFDWADVQQAWPRAPASAFFSAAEAADIGAVAAQIVPADDSPGAREAGAVDFIDRALATFLSRLAADYRAQFAQFQRACHERHGSTVSFASLESAQQIEFLKQVDQTPFFITTRLLTLLAMFARPEYGGNRDGIGWKLLGFEDGHAFQPPFGYYDRGYPGFIVSPGRVE